MSTYDKYFGQQGLFSKGQPRTMQEWKSFVDGLSRQERSDLYPGMHKDLIPATEMLDAMGAGSTDISGNQAGGYDNMNSNNATFSSSSNDEKDLVSGLAQYADEMLTLIPRILNHPRGLDTVTECAMEHFGLTATGGGMVAVGQKTIKKPRMGIAGGGKSKNKTSIASTVLRKIFPQKVRLRFGKKTLGGVLGRIVPFVGAAILVYDVMSILRCTSRKL